MGWALLIARENGLPDSAVAPAALFLTVWTVYLADRIFDALRSDHPENLPPRHRFARRHWRGLAALGTTNAAILLSVLVPDLNRGTVVAGFVLGLLTLFYFIGLRLRRTPSRFPAKEFIVGFCFATGALVAAHRFEPSFPTVLCAATLTPLFTANCLAISLAESGYDRVSDPAAHFANRAPSKKLPLALLIPAVLGATVLLFLPGFRQTAASAIMGAVLIAFIIVRSPDNSDRVQPIADATLLIPWFLLW